MNVYENSWVVEGSREEIWAVLHPQKQFDRRLTTVETPRVMQHDTTRVEVVCEGDEDGRGLVRRCWFLAPWYLGGQARSWEIVSEVRAPDYQRYDVLFCTPPHASVQGWYRLDPESENTTRVTIHEEYRMEKRWLAPLLERRVHDFFLRDNDDKFKGMIEDGLKAYRKARETPVR